MAVLIPSKIIEVDDFRDFCKKFNINTNIEAGIDDLDEVLITEELNKLDNENWLLNFIDNRIDGYFRLQLIE